MAKKNSTKTATKEAIQDSIPKIQTLTGWKGINLQQLPLDSDVYSKDGRFTREHTTDDWNKKAQSDSQPNFLAMQNNLYTSSNGSIETRWETIRLKDVMYQYKLTGVAINYNNYIYAVCSKDNKEYLYRFRLPDEFGQEIGDWEQIELHDVNPAPTGKTKNISIKSLLVFQSRLIVLTQVDIDGAIHGEMYDGPLDNITSTGVTNARRIAEPATAPAVTKIGIGEGSVARIRFTYVYCNKYGSTMQSDTTTVNTDVSPVEFQSTKYLRLTGTLPTDHADITGVDIYCTMDESQKYIFIGHVGVSPTDTSWAFSWLGAMMDVSQWTSSSLTLPYENTTQGVDACYVDQYDGRLYFYGGSCKYRLYIGGNIGHELSVSTGLGGAFVDIEPGSGQEIRKVLKFKTYNGATIVTLLTYHPNTNKSSRYNLLETEITVTNENNANGYKAEKVDSVLGTSSYTGSDTFIDGLYAINRYGLAFTTKVQENQNNLRVMYCSDAIAPVFEDIYGYQVNNARLLCINETIYLCMASMPEDGDTTTVLDDIIFCYDTKTKAWFTYKAFDNRSTDKMINLINIDYNHYIEGLGVICADSIYLVPTVGDEHSLYYDGDTPKLGYPKLDTYIETHELALRQPTTNLFYCNQLEINFDYICAPLNPEQGQNGLDIWLEGYDIYGRHFKITKKVIEPELLHYTNYYMRVDRYVRSFRMFIRGKAHYRLTHINMKCFQQSSSIGNAYGFDVWHGQKKQHGLENLKHHAVKNYNDLKEIILT